jgi:two-component system sensor histidine kinase DctS
MDRVGIEQVLTNLLRNAGDAVASQAGPRCIEVGAHRSDGGIEVEVRDSGLGLGGRSLDALCARFHTTKRDGASLGLGLGICRTVLESHGGSLEAGDRAEGGAWFRFKLPLHPTHLPPVPAGSANEAALP